MNDAFAEGGQNSSLGKCSMENICWRFTSVALIAFFALATTPLIAEQVPDTGRTDTQTLSSAVRNIVSQVRGLKADQIATFEKVVSRLTRMQTTLDELNVSTGTAIVSMGMAYASPGSEIEIPMTLLTGDLSLGGLQMNVIFPAGISLISIRPGPVIEDAGKVISENPVNGGIRFVVVGLNNVPLDEGLLMTIRLAVDPMIRSGNHSIYMQDPSTSNMRGSVEVVSTKSGTVVVR